MLTVIVMSLKGSIIAARAYKPERGGRANRESTIITEGGGDLKNTDDLKTRNKSWQRVKARKRGRALNPGNHSERFSHK